MTDASARSRAVRIGLIGAGRIGSSHAELIQTGVHGAELVGVADAFPAAAERVAGRLGVTAYATPDDLLADDSIDAVVIAATTEAHVALVVAAAAAGKAVFCEKPMGMTLEGIERAIEACAEAGVTLQVGFNRRFAADFVAAHQAVLDGVIGTPQLMRSLTRDPGPARFDRVPASSTIFMLTLIHDFDTLLWLNPGAEPVEVYAVADALVAPELKPEGLLDTAVVVIRFDNGAVATAEANFSALYGYDVRGEVFGSKGMVTAGDGRRTGATLYTATGISAETARSDTELLRDAYIGEFVEFAAAVREGRSATVTGEDARRALRIALACVESVESGAPVRLGS